MDQLKLGTVTGKLLHACIMNNFTLIAFSDNDYKKRISIVDLNWGYLQYRVHIYTTETVHVQGLHHLHQKNNTSFFNPFLSFFKDKKVQKRATRI